MGCGGSKSGAVSVVELEEYATRPSTASAAKGRGDGDGDGDRDGDGSSGAGGNSTSEIEDLDGGHDGNISSSSPSKKKSGGGSAIAASAAGATGTASKFDILQIDPEEYPGRAAHEADITASRTRSKSLTGNTSIVSSGSGGGDRAHGLPVRSASRTPVEKGVCTECGRPVLDTEPRSMGINGTYRHEPCPNGALDLANAAVTGTKENAGTAATMAEVRAEAAADIAKERATWDKASLSMNDRMMRNAAARQRKSSSTASLAPMATD